MSDLWDVVYIILILSLGTLFIEEKRNILITETLTLRKFISVVSSPVKSNYVGRQFKAQSQAFHYSIQKRLLPFFIIPFLY